MHIDIWLFTCMCKNYGQHRRATPKGVHGRVEVISALDIEDEWHMRLVAAMEKPTDQSSCETF